MLSALSSKLSESYDVDPRCLLQHTRRIVVVLFLDASHPVHGPAATVFPPLMIGEVE